MGALSQFRSHRPVYFQQSKPDPQMPDFYDCRQNHLSPHRRYPHGDAYSFAVCTAAGLVCALLLWASPSAASVLEPFLVLLNSLPKSALAPLLIVWLGNNTTTIVTAAVSVALFGSILTLYNGFCQTDEDKIRLIRSLGGTRADVLLKVLLPGSLPMVINNMKVNIGLCWSASSLVNFSPHGQDWDI